MFLVGLPRSRENHNNDLLGRSYVDRLTATPIADEKGSEFWTPRTTRSLETQLDARRGFSSKPGGGSHRPPVVTHCSDLSWIPLNVDELLTVLGGPFDSRRDPEADRGPRRLRVLRLVCVVARPEEPETM
jgi:hypothetical protein